MHRLVSMTLKLLLGISLLFVAISAPAAAASKVPVNLRVVTWQGKILFDGKVRTGTTKIKPNSDCLGGAAGKARTVQGSTALGALKDASTRSAALRPFLISDGQFGFGICGFGKTLAVGENWWALKYNHRMSSAGGEETKVTRNSDILWYLSESYMAPGLPSELVLKAPAKVRKGVTAKVRVFAYDDAGKRKPVAGAKLSVGGAVTDGKGFAKVKVQRKTRLVARVAGSIPSNRAVIKIKK